MTELEWLSAFEARFRAATRDFCERTGRREPAVRSTYGSGPWSGGRDHVVWLGCVLPSAAPDAPDEVVLEASFRDLGNAPTMIAEVCWGHPSGRVEATWPAAPQPVSAVAIDRFFDELPKLLEALERALERGRPVAG